MPIYTIYAMQAWQTWHKILGIVRERFQVRDQHFPYLGKNPERPSDESLATFVVKTLLGNYLNMGYNVTCDNFFTSADLAKQLMAQKTSLVGTPEWTDVNLVPPLHISRGN